MLYINIGFLLLILGSYLYSLKSTDDRIKKIDRKEHILYFLYPLADFILRGTGLNKKLSKKRNVADAIKALHLTAKPDLINRLFWCSRVSYVLVILILVNLMSIFSILSTENSLLFDGKYIKRPDYGEGSKDVKLSVSMKDETDTDSKQDDIPGSFDLTIRVGEKNYTKEELELIFRRSFEYLKKVVLGSNQSTDLIYDNLNFIKQIPGTSIKVDWVPEDYNLIQMDGAIENDKVNQEGTQTSVTVILSYGEKQKEYTQKQTMTFKIMPKQYKEEELLKQRLGEEINTASEQTKEDKYLELPDTVDQYRLSWNDHKKGSNMILLFLGLILAAAVWLFGDKELEKKMKARKEQMLIDYPEIINKFTLLINAGMTTKQAWIKMAEDYAAMKSKKNNKIRYAYEEMLLTTNELKLGLPENVSYEQYGKRAGITAYIKFSSLISQNLKKGTKGFTEALIHEAGEAFEERKEVARRRGEEAGTKLLIPMMIMLIIVFLIIMIPAFLSFRI